MRPRNRRKPRKINKVFKQSKRDSSVANVRGHKLPSLTGLANIVGAPVLGLSSAVTSVWYSLGSKLTPQTTPPVPTICIGSMRGYCCGRFLLASWMLGWSLVKGLSPLLIGKTRETGSAPGVYEVGPESSILNAGAELPLLSRYFSQAKILIGSSIKASVKESVAAFSPEIIFLYDTFFRFGLYNDANLVVLDQQDLEADWNRVWPLGPWRASSKALVRATAIILFMTVEDFQIRKNLIGRRLGFLNVPVFHMYMRIWRLREIFSAEAEQSARTSFKSEQTKMTPYLFVSRQGRHQLYISELEKKLGYPPRIAVTFPDNYHISVQDRQKVESEAKRMRCERIITPPEEASFFGGLKEMPLWTWDPEVIFGESLGSEQSFAVWWGRICKDFYDRATQRSNKSRFKNK